MLIAGAGGFAREVLEIILQQEDTGSVVFYDDQDPELTRVYDQYEVIKNKEDARVYFKTDSRFCIGVGGPGNREYFFNLFQKLGGFPQTLISPYTQTGRNNVRIGDGSIIATGTVITTSVSIGKGVLINLNCTIGHDSAIGDFTELSPGVHVSGRCVIANKCSIGTGAVILPGIHIGEGAVIGAGAVVNKNIDARAVVAGVPAKPIAGN